MQPHNLEEKFDGIYNKTIPLILFSFYEDSKVFSDLLASLYDAMYRNDEISFNEILNKLDSKINERRLFDSHKEGLIKSFSDRFISLDQRIHNIEGTYIEFKGMVDRINKDHNCISAHGRSINALHKKIKSTNFHLQSKEQDKKVVVRDTKRLPKSTTEVPIESNEKQGIEITCPVCKRTWIFKGKKTKANCGKCRKTFSIPKENEKNGLF